MTENMYKGETFLVREELQEVSFSLEAGFEPDGELGLWVSGEAGTRQGEYALKLTIFGRLGDENGRVCFRATYLGIFNLARYPEEDRHRALKVDGSRVLFPSVRNFLKHCLREACLPEFVFPHIDFDLEDGDSEAVASTPKMIH